MRALAEHLRGPRRLRRPTPSHEDRQFHGEGAPLGRGRQKGGEGDACRQAIGRSRGGRTTKIRALCDIQGRTHAILLTSGNIADITAATSLVSAAATSAALVGDKGYDSNHLRHFLAERSIAAVIPSTATREVPIPHDAACYRLRNVIERTFCRVKDLRGTATRYDKTARNFLAAICLVSAITYWA